MKRMYKRKGVCVVCGSLALIGKGNKFCSRKHQLKYRDMYREKNKDKIGVYGKQYYEKNKDAINAKAKQYREKNKDKIGVYGKQYYEKNKDAINAKAKQYREKNKDKIKQYREKNKDKIKQYREKNKDKIKAQIYAARERNRGAYDAYQAKYRAEHSRLKRDTHGNYG